MTTTATPSNNKKKKEEAYMMIGLSLFALIVLSIGLIVVLPSNASASQDQGIAVRIFRMFFGFWILPLALIGILSFVIVSNFRMLLVER